MILEYNLQFFAKEGPGGEKTEEATPKKLNDSRKDGSVAKSKELVNGLSLLAMFVAIRFAMGYIGPRLIELFYKYWLKIAGWGNQGITVRELTELSVEITKDSLMIVLPFLLIGFVVAFVGNVIQFKWMVTAKPMQPKFSKINPVSGFKRMFSSRAIFDLLKSLAQFGLIGYIAYDTISKRVNELYLLYDMGINQSLELLMDIIWDMGIKIAVVLLIIGVVDFMFQRYKHKQEMMMTKQEVRDEYKNTEGDPHVKGQQKQRMRQISQRRMMASVPDADVVITNPTHFAVALKYDAEKHSAPIVVAKGADFLAAKIKELAKENQVMIKEDKALARMLYYNVDIEQEIPPELFQAVADILAYVYRTQKK